MGKKYIIEMKENERLYKAKLDAFNGPMIQEIAGAPYTESDIEQVRKEAYKEGYTHGAHDAKKVFEDHANEAYQKGLNDAWETARKIVCLISDGGFTQDVLDSIFGSQSYQSIMAKYSASDAIEKISKYKPVQTQIGDEVEGDFGIGMVTKPLEGGAYIMWKDGSFGSHTANEFKLTGRNFPELVEILRKMKEK